MYNRRVNEIFELHETPDIFHESGNIFYEAFLAALGMTVGKTVGMMRF